MLVHWENRYRFTHLTTLVMRCQLSLFLAENIAEMSQSFVYVVYRVGIFTDKRAMESHDRSMRNLANHCPGLYQCLNGLAPSYMADDCQLVSDVRPRRLRSSDSVTCAVRRTRTTYGDRCFAVAGPRAWNSLPTELRRSDSLGRFKQRLKTHSICLGYGTTAPSDFL